MLWSVTPYCTAELFAELKVGRAEPTVEQLPQVSLFNRTLLTWVFIYSSSSYKDGYDAVDLLISFY